MKFLNLNTGYSFDGLWTENQTKGYIFWFPDEQSINLTYTMPICVLTTAEDTDIDADMSVPALTLTMEDNDIFSFIVIDDKTDTIDGYTFTEPIYTNTITTIPEKIGNYYAHIFNIACTSQNEGEYICKINIGDEGYIRVGADFYGECEPAYINLSNMGVEIPDMVQKAIYDSNVHEDFTDNILINRKFKELLSNYWDIIANKGSYKSLINSLEWFEWNDNLKIREIWKHDEAGKTIFDDREIMSIFEDKIKNYANNFIKTTYVSLYYCMQDELPSYDNEMNPQLNDLVFKWSRNDLQLKIALLAQFFGAYFMPIHMSILHAAVEDKVFTNTIKALHGADVKHEDCFGDFNYVECNVKDNDIFKLTNVRSQTTSGTIYNDINSVFGVDTFPTDKSIGNIELFANQYYTGPGVIIPFIMKIPNQLLGDFVKQTIVDVNEDRHIMYDRFDVNNNKELFHDEHNECSCEVNPKIDIKFNLLLKEANDYALRFTFILASGKTINKKLNISVADVDNLNINIYKVKAKDDTKGFTYEDFADMTNSQYFFKIQPTQYNDPNAATYYQYLPYMLPDDPRYINYDGIKLTRTVVVDVRDRLQSEIDFISGIMSKNFLKFVKYDYTDPENHRIAYMIFVSKRFYADVPKSLFDNVFYYTFNVIRNDLGFYPQFHNLEKMDGTSIDDYTINQYEAVCCAAEINDGKIVQPFRYGHLITGSEWTFDNVITGETLTHPVSSRKPFIVKTNTRVNDGYYNISFKYSLSNGISDECKLDSAFRIKSI